MQKSAVCHKTRSKTSSMKTKGLKSLCVAVAVMTLASACTSVMHVAAEGADTVRMTSRIDRMGGETNVPSLIAPYRDSVDAEMNEVLAVSTVPLIKEKPEGTMGNWVADATMHQAELLIDGSVDFSICNYSGMRVDRVAEGEITRRYMFEIMPFDNFLVLIELDGSTTKKLFDHMAESGGWPISNTVTYTIDNGKAVDVKIKNQPLDPGGTYTVVMSDYVANGGSGCGFLEGLPHKALNVYYRDAMIGEAQLTTQKGLKMAPKIEGRVKVMAHE